MRSKVELPKPSNYHGAERAKDGLEVDPAMGAATAPLSVGQPAGAGMQGLGGMQLKLTKTAKGE